MSMQQGRVTNALLKLESDFIQEKDCENDADDESPCPDTAGPLGASIMNAIEIDDDEDDDEEYGQESGVDSGTSDHEQQTVRVPQTFFVEMISSQSPMPSPSPLASNEVELDEHLNSVDMDDFLSFEECDLEEAFTEEDANGGKIEISVAKMQQEMNPLEARRISDEKRNAAKDSLRQFGLLQEKKEKPASLIAELSPEQKFVHDLIVNNGANVFVTGKAGTGKSFLLHHVVTSLKEKEKTVNITAPTGIAAIQVGGTTLHSFSGFGIDMHKTAVSLKYKVASNQFSVENWRKVQVLIIDEISMVSEEFFDKLDFVARHVRGRLHEPFGGIQVICFGDFFQLSPVPNRKYCPQCGALKQKPLRFDVVQCDPLRKGCGWYYDPRTKYAFQSAAWDNADFINIELTKIFRQTDQDFIQALNEIRLGKVTERTIELFRNCRRNLNTSDNILPTKIYPLRKNVQHENSVAFDTLPGKCESFVAIDRPDSERAKKYLPMLEELQSPKNFDLKVGAQVILLANLDATAGLVNGSRGVVLDFIRIETLTADKDLQKRYWGDDEIQNAAQLANVLHKTKDYSTVLPIVLFSNELTEIILPHVFDVIVKPEVKVSRIQLPLALGWAYTIHKCQGMSLDKVTMDLSKCFAEGQVYVALSRARSFHGLQIDSFKASLVKVSQDVIEFAKTYAHFDEDGKIKHPVETREDPTPTTDILLDDILSANANSARVQDQQWQQGLIGCAKSHILTHLRDPSGLRGENELIQDFLQNAMKLYQKACRVVPLSGHANYYRAQSSSTTSSSSLHGAATNHRKHGIIDSSDDENPPKLYRALDQATLKTSALANDSTIDPLPSASSLPAPNFTPAPFPATPFAPTKFPAHRSIPTCTTGSSSSAVPQAAPIGSVQHLTRSVSFPTITPTAARLPTRNPTVSSLPILTPTATPIPNHIPATTVAPLTSYGTPSVSLNEQTSVAYAPVMPAVTQQSDEMVAGVIRGSAGTCVARPDPSARSRQFSRLPLNKMVLAAKMNRYTGNDNVNFDANTMPSVKSNPYSDTNTMPSVKSNPYSDANIMPSAKPNPYSNCSSTSSVKSDPFSDAPSSSVVKCNPYATSSLKENSCTASANYALASMKSQMELP